MCHYEPVEKTVHGGETHQLSVIERVLGAAVSKEGHTDSLLGLIPIASLK